MDCSISEIVVILLELGFTGIKASSSVVKASCECSLQSKSPSFVVMPNLKGAGYFCHRCHRRGRLEDLIWDAWARGDHPTDAFKIMMSYKGRCQIFDPSNLEYAPLAKKPTVIKDVVFERPDHGVQLDLDGKIAIQKAVKVTESDLNRFKLGPSLYLRSRGFDDSIQERFQMMRNEKDHRIVFPIRDWDGVLKGWSQRLVYSGDVCLRCNQSIMEDGVMKYKCDCGALYAKYIHSRGFSKNDSLFGEHLYQPGSSPILVEGFTDVMRLSQGNNELFSPLGFLGAHASIKQLQRVLKKTEGPIFTLRDHDDPDKYPLLADGIAPGDLAAKSVEKGVMRLSSRPVIHIVPPMGSDPGDLTEKQLQAVADIIETVRSEKTVLKGGTIFNI